MIFVKTDHVVTSFPVSVGNAVFRSAIVLKPNMLRDIKLSPLHQIGVFGVHSYGIVPVYRLGTGATNNSNSL